MEKRDVGERRSVTVVKGWRQFSLFAAQELKPLTVPRWQRSKRRREREQEREARLKKQQRHEHPCPAHSDL
jgi:hypothetical protein